MQPLCGLLASQSRRAVWELLEQLRRDTGLTISLTTHYMDEAERLCDRIAIVDGGKIIAIGTPAVTTRGMKEAEMAAIADMICEVLLDIKNLDAAHKVRQRVRGLTVKFPLPY